MDMCGHVALHFDFVLQSIPSCGSGFGVGGGGGGGPLRYSWTARSSNGVLSVQSCIVPLPCWKDSPQGNLERSGWNLHQRQTGAVHPSPPPQQLSGCQRGMFVFLSHFENKNGVHTHCLPQG